MKFSVMVALIGVTQAIRIGDNNKSLAQTKSV